MKKHSTIPIFDFAVDLYNAAVCATKLKDKTKLLHYADKLAGKGVGENFFKRSVFKNYYNDKEFRQIILKSKKLKAGKTEKNLEYVKQLNKFISLDSTYNKLRLTKYRDYEKNPDTIENLFYTNTKNLLDFVKSNGYYSEMKLGADIAHDTIIKYLRKPDMVVLHYLEMGRDIKLIEELKTLILDNADSGAIKPYHYSPIIDLCEGRGIFGDIGNWIFRIHDCRLFRINEADVETFNNYRRQYNLESIDDL